MDQSLSVLRQLVNLVAQSLAGARESGTQQQQQLELLAAECSTVRDASAEEADRHRRSVALMQMEIDALRGRDAVARALEEGAVPLALVATRNASDLSGVAVSLF